MTQSILPPRGSLWVATQHTEAKPNPSSHWPHRVGETLEVRPGDLLLVVETRVPWVRVSWGDKLGWLHATAVTRMALRLDDTA